jgi:23S rRNA (adenine-N6)-dimethyltransferase
VSVRRPAQGAPGQHFLRSSRLVAELVRDAGVAPGDLVVDVGAGTGVITRALVDTGARVVAVEADHRLAAALERRFGGSNVTVVAADACRFAWPTEPFAVVANLPFAGSRAILAGMLDDPTSELQSVDAIVQWELAQKEAAVWPATLRSTFWRAWHDVAIVARLSRRAFAPAPSVDAAVLRVTRRRSPLLPPGEHLSYRRFLERAFRSNAPLDRALRGLASRRELRRLAPALGFDENAKPRDLDARQWARLYSFASRSDGGRPRSRSRGRVSS